MGTGVRAGACTTCYQRMFLDVGCGSTLTGWCHVGKVTDARYHIEKGVRVGERVWVG